MLFRNSSEHFARGQKLLPSGVNTNTRARAPHPIYFASARGGRATDIDGNVFNDILILMR
jgi:glutamate-1-semialdehyde aminotransferase